MAKNVSANNCANDRCYAEIRNAPVGAYKPTEKKLSNSAKSVIDFYLYFLIRLKLCVHVPYD